MLLIDRDIFAAWAATEESHWWFAARRMILRRVADALTAAGPGRSVMDIGCGVGSTLTAFHPEYACIGYDPSPDAIEFARARHPAFDLHVGTAVEASGALGKVDVVLLNDVIEHVPDDRALLGSVVSCMRPGASLIVTVPADMKLWSPHDERMGHFRRYDAAMLDGALAELPLKRLFVSHFMSRLYPVVRAMRALSRLRGQAAGASGTDLSSPPRLVNTLLARIFAGEAGRLLGVVHGRARPYGRGVSLIGAFRRV
jgi:SAM-dependent methyltransferase